MHDNSGRAATRQDSASSGRLRTGSSALVITPDPSAAGRVLAGTPFRHVTVLPPEPGSWPEPESTVDLGVVIGVGAEPAAVDVALSYLARALGGDGVVALSVDPGQSVLAEPGLWTGALAGWRFGGVRPVGEEPCVLLHRVEPADAAAAREQAGLVIGALTGLAARPTAPEAEAAGPAALLRGLDEPDPVLAVGDAQTGSSQHRRPSTERPTQRRRRRTWLLRSRRARRAVAAIGVLVLVAVVVVGIATSAAWWGWVLVAGLVLALAVRQEMWNRRHVRRSAELARESARTRRVTQRIVAATRANATATRDALRTGGVLDTRLRREFDQVQATVNLFDRIDVDGLVPSMRGWAASPDVVNALLDEFITLRPRVVIECGSGVSTLWLALAARDRDVDCRIVSLEHDPGYLEGTRRVLERHGVAHLVDLRHAPLTAFPVDGHATPWYDPSVLEGVEGAGLVFVDGPPQLTGPMARFPALPVLVPHLAPECVVILDDASRPDEARAVERWLLLHPDFSVERITAEKGAAVLRRHAVDPTLESTPHEKDESE